VKIYIVTEYQIGRHDFPEGCGRIVLITCDMNRAERESGSDKNLWQLPIRGFDRVTRYFHTYEVQDVPKEK
jgi:hypothetical protein